MLSLDSLSDDAGKVKQSYIDAGGVGNYLNVTAIRSQDEVTQTYSAWQMLVREHSIKIGERWTDEITCRSRRCSAARMIWVGERGRNTSDVPRSRRVNAAPQMKVVALQKTGLYIQYPENFSG